MGGCFKVGPVSGPDIPSEVSETNVELVAMVANCGVVERARITLHGWGGDHAREWSGGSDPLVPRGPEAAPRGVEEKIAAHRALPREHRLDPIGVRTDQYVAVEQVAVHEVATLRTGVHERSDPLFNPRRKRGELGVSGQRGAPAVRGAFGVVDQAGQQELTPREQWGTRLVPKDRAECLRRHGVQRNEQTSKRRSESPT